MTTFFSMALAFLLSFFVGMAGAPLLLRLLRRKKAGQNILSYVEQHNQKQGIPTMGGLLFLICVPLATALFAYESSFTPMLLLLFAFYGLIGFLDDFIKIHFHRNLGLKAYQKVISQVGVAAIAAYYCASHPEIGTAIRLPLAKVEFDLGFWGYFFFAILVFLAMSNAVNLTDGLDGLAGSTSAVYFATFAVVAVWGIGAASDTGRVLLARDWLGIGVFCTSLVGAILAFLWHNAPKASVFMGDTGSMALGGAAASVALFTKNPLIAPVTGIMFVVSCISVILQVSVYKLRRGKRLFRMAPLHHHLELIGYGESKIVAFYTILTVVGSVVALLLI